MNVKFEYKPARFAFGRVNGEFKDSVEVKWITRRRRLPRTVKAESLTLQPVKTVSE